MLVLGYNSTQRSNEQGSLLTSCAAAITEKPDIPNTVVCRRNNPDAPPDHMIVFTSVQRLSAADNHNTLMEAISSVASPA